MADQVSKIISNPGRVKTDLQQEMMLGWLVTASYQTFAGQFLRSLPRYCDDAERDFGLDIYERMMKDPTLFGAMSTIRIQALAEGARFTSPIHAPSVSKPDPKQQSLYNKGIEVRDFVERCFDNLAHPLPYVLEELMDAFIYGHCVAEQTYEIKGNDLALTKLRPKPRSSYAFVVDQFMNCYGFVARKMCNIGILPLIFAPVDVKEVIPREKCLILTHMPPEGDPRGTSLIRAAYNSWYLKQQIWPQYLKFLAQFGTPSIAAYLPPDAGEVEVRDIQGNSRLDGNGNPIYITPEEAMLQKIIGFANGTAIVLPNESRLDFLESKGDGSAYVNAIDLLDRQMVRAILLSTRATMEAEHGSKADSGTSQDLLGSVISSVRRRIEVAVYRDCIIPLVRYNFGDEIAESMCPYMSLTKVASQDVSDIGNMIANLARGGLIQDDQVNGIYQMIGLPETDMEALLERKAEERQNAADQASMLGGLLPVQGDKGNTEG